MITMFTPEKNLIDFFNKRTNKHIRYVVIVGSTIVRNLDKDLRIKCILLPKLDLFMSRLKRHDASKFGPEERIPYIYLAWWRRQNKLGIEYSYPEGIEPLVKLACKHHITSNRHHQEYHNIASDMSNIDIAEMVCDWGAISLELNTSLLNWVDLNIANYDFTKQQLIYIQRLIKLTGIK